MFKLTKIEGGRINVFEPEIHTVGSDAAVKAGQALVLNSSGKLAACGAAVKPTFIALADGDEGEDIHVGRVESNQIYVTNAVSGLVVGAKYQTSGGTVITGTPSTGGGAEIVFVDTATNKAYIRFV